MAKTAAALIIGNEILSGKIQDANLNELAPILRSLGVELRRAVIVTDESHIIACEVKDLSSAHDYLFTSGGVGPTHDDVTMEAVAQAFGVPLVTEPKLLGLLKDFHGERFNEGHRRMTLVPDGARLITAPRIPWPLTTMRNVWILPGVPEVFRMKMRIIRACLESDRPFLSKAVYTQVEEAELKPTLDRIVEIHPQVMLGSYPAWENPRYQTKVTFDSKNDAALDEALSAFLALLPEGEPQWVE